jgi:hypothetical protein
LLFACKSQSRYCIFVGQSKEIATAARRSGLTPFAMRTSSFSSVARESAIRYFGARTVTALEKKGVTFHGQQAAPAYDGDWAQTGVSFQVVINETLCVRQPHQIRAMANSSWMPEPQEA